MSTPARPPLRCPRCAGATLETRGYEGVEIELCARCGGLWCEARDWNVAVLGPRPDSFVVVAEPADAGPGAVVAGIAQPVTSTVLLATTRISCPTCKAGLKSIGVSGIEGLQLDLCESCQGIWLDRDEWRHLDALRSWEEQRQGIERETTWDEWCFQMFLRLPIEFNIKPRIKPIVTMLIVAICTLITLLMWLDPPQSEEEILKFAALGTRSFQPENWYSIFTNMFLHAGWLHLMGNMYLLYILGDNVEDVMGHWAFLIFYLACGVAAAVVHMVAAPAAPMVGASGAIAGVIAAYLVLFRHARLTFMFLFWQLKPPAWVWIGIWLVIQLVAGFADESHVGGGVAWFAHIGGFFAGMLFVLPFRSAIVARSPLLYLIDTRRIKA